MTDMCWSIAQVLQRLKWGVQNSQFMQGNCFYNFKWKVAQPCLVGKWNCLFLLHQPLLAMNLENIAKPQNRQHATHLKNVKGKFKKNFSMWGFE